MNTSVKNKTIFISGASSGIGRAAAQIFAKHGAKLILCARRIDRLKNLAKELSKKFKTKCYLLELDVSKRKDVADAIKNLPTEWQNIDLLLNNAGLASGRDKIHEGQIDDWEKMIDTNCKGLLYLTRAILPKMVARNIGHVINIGSIAGHEIYPSGNVYCATKFAVRALTQGIKMDVLGTNIRVTSIDPGLVETEFSEVRFYGDKEKAKQVYAGMKPLSAEDIADTIYYCATRPAHVNILDMVILPTAQSAATQVHRDKEN